MRILIEKRRDGSSVLKCVRVDGSETWQKQDGAQAAFFPLHDLTHFAVESELGVRSGFYGLIAHGWTIDDTTGKGARGPLPADAIFVEGVVGTLDAERAGGVRWTAEEFNDSAARLAAGGGRAAPRTLTDDELDRIRQRRAELFARWRDLEPGEALDLLFP